MKKNYGLKLNILLFLLIIVVLGIANLCQTDRPTVSENENRKLAAWPEFSRASLASGDFTAQIDNFVADTFLFREPFLLVSSGADRFKGFQTKEIPVLAVMGDTNGDGGESVDSPFGETGDDDTGKSGAEGENPKDSQSLPEDDSLRPKDGTHSNSDATSDAVLVYYGNRIMERFNYNQAAWDDFANVMNRIDEGFDGRVRVISMIAPSSSAFYLDRKYSELSDSQAVAIDHAYTAMNDTIVKVSAFGTMKAHSDEYLYFRSDHHWTALGAYYAYRAFLRTSFPGDNPVLPEELDSGSAEGFLGYLYSYSPQPAVKEEPDTVYYWFPEEETDYTVYDSGWETDGKSKELIDLKFKEKKNKYEIFLGGDAPLGKVETGLENGRVLILTKDSYGNALVPWLVHHYQTIYVVDPRYFRGNLATLAEEWGATDVMVFNNALNVGNSKWRTMDAGMFRF